MIPSHAISRVSAEEPPRARPPRIWCPATRNGENPTAALAAAEPFKLGHAPSVAEEGELPREGGRSKARRLPPPGDPDHLAEKPVHQYHALDEHADLRGDPGRRVGRRPASQIEQVDGARARHLHQRSAFGVAMPGHPPGPRGGCGSIGLTPRTPSIAMPTSPPIAAHHRQVHATPRPAQIDAARRASEALHRALELNPLLRGEVGRLLDDAEKLAASP
jgi:hypothetical protein